MFSLYIIFLNNCLCYALHSHYLTDTQPGTVYMYVSYKLRNHQ